MNMNWQTETTTNNELDYKQLFINLCKFCEGFSSEPTIVQFYNCGLNWFKNKEEHDCECEDCNQE